MVFACKKAVGQRLQSCKKECSSIFCWPLVPSGIWKFDFFHLRNVKSCKQLGEYSELLRSQRKLLKWKLRSSYSWRALEVTLSKCPSSILNNMSCVTPSGTSWDKDSHYSNVLAVLVTYWLSTGVRIAHRKAKVEKSKVQISFEYLLAFYFIFTVTIQYSSSVPVFHTKGSTYPSFFIHMRM